MSGELTRKERYFLALLAEAPDATIGIGTEVGYALQRRGLVKVVKFGRLGITELGRGVLAGHREPERNHRPRKREPKGTQGNLGHASKGQGQGQLTLF